MNALDFILIAILVIAGAADAVRDVLTFHWSGSYFARFPMDSFFGSPNASKGSWVRKYKGNDPKQGPRFWGSTTVFVAVTDAFHLSKTLSIRVPLIFLSAVILWGSVEWYSLLIGLVASSGAFNLVYYTTRGE